MLHVLPPTNQTCFTTNQVVTRCVDTDFWLDKITRELRHLHVFALYLLIAQQVQVLLKKSTTTLYFLQQIFAAYKVIYYKTGLNVRG